jgi:putative ABC transport system permease protein
VIKAGGASMRPLGILHLYRVRLRSRLVQEALAAIGIAVGVALLFASQVANTSLNGSVKQLTSGLIGQSRLQLAARSPEGFPEALLGQVQNLAGVRAAAPVLEVQANVMGPDGSQPVFLIGANPRFVRFGGGLLRHFRAAALARQHALALPLPIAKQIGASSLQIIRIQTGAETAQALLGITLQEGDIGALANSPVALAPLAYAQRLAGMKGRVSRIFVQPAPNRYAQVKVELQHVAAGRINVVPANNDALLFDSAAQPTNQSTALFAAISALVGFLFAFNAMLLTTPARRSLIADLRLDGYSPWTVIEILLFDALLLGIVSCVLGLVLGEELSLRLFHASPGYLSFAFAVGSQRIVTWQSVAIAIAGGMLAACVGVLTPFASRPSTRAKEQQRARSLGSVLALAGLVCLAATTTILVFAPQAAVVGVVALTAALLLSLPLLLRGVLALIERVTEDIRARAPWVALGELRSSWDRTVGIAATGAIAVFGSVAIQGAHADLQRGLDQSARDVSRQAEVWAFPPGLSNLLATEPFRAGSVARLASLPGIASVRIYRGGFLDYDDRRVWVSAEPTAQREMVFAHQLVAGSLASADRRVREGGWAVISRALATQHHLHIGSSFTLPTLRPTTFRVAGLSTNVGWPPGAVIINAQDYAKAWASTQASAYEIATLAGASPAVVRREVQGALGPSSGLQVQTAGERERQQRIASRQGLQRLSEISALVLIAAVLAIAAAIGSMIWQRRAHLANLKLDGFSDLAVWRTLLFESILLVGSGCLVGAIFGLYGQVLGSRAILALTGFPVVFSLGIPRALGSLALVTVVAVTITAIPGYRVARVRPAAA